MNGGKGQVKGPMSAFNLVWKDLLVWAVERVHVEQHRLNRGGLTGTVVSTHASSEHVQPNETFQ